MTNEDKATLNLSKNAIRQIIDERLAELGFKEETSEPDINYPENTCFNYLLKKATHEHAYKVIVVPEEDIIGFIPLGIPNDKIQYMLEQLIECYERGYEQGVERGWALLKEKIEDL